MFGLGLWFRGREPRVGVAALQEVVGCDSTFAVALIAIVQLRGRLTVGAVVVVVAAATVTGGISRVLIGVLNPDGGLARASAWALVFHVHLARGRREAQGQCASRSLVILPRNSDLTVALFD